MNLKNVIFFLLFFALITHLTFAKEIFKNFDEHIYVDTNSISVTKNITLLNQGKIGVVPGEIIFRMKGINLSDLSDYSAQDSYGNKFSVNINTNDGFVQLIANDYVPIFAGTQQQIIVKYKIALKPQGLFFYHYLLPLLDTTIPIDEGKVTLSYPKNLHLTYVKDANCNPEGCSWDLKQIKDVEFELSTLPLPRTKVLGVKLFWYSILIISSILFGLSFFIFFKKKRRYHYY